MLLSQGWVQSEIKAQTLYLMEKKTKRGRRLRIGNFQGYWRNSKGIFLGVSLVLGLKISEGCNTIMWKIYGKAYFCLEFPRVKFKT